MGRRLRTTVPQLEETLQPEWPDLRKFRESQEAKQRRREEIFNERHRTKELPPLEVGQKVWIVDTKTFGKVSGIASTPRSYHVETETGHKIRRNRRELMPTDKSTPEQLSMYQYLAGLQEGSQNYTEERNRIQTPVITPQSSPRGNNRKKILTSKPTSKPLTRQRGKATETQRGRGRARSSLSPVRPGGATSGAGPSTRTRAITKPERFRDVL